MTSSLGLRARASWRAGLLAILLAQGHETASGAADEIARLVAAPLTPGNVALLSRYPADPRVVERLRTAFASPSSAVRAVAARAAAVGNLGSVLPDLKDALARETDAGAAREGIRALCTIGGPAADPEALTATRRFSPRLDAFYAITVARLRGIQALPEYFSTLRDLDLSSHDREIFFRRAADRSGPDLLGAAGSLALSRRATADWAAILAVASERGVALDEGPLIAALRGDDTLFRGEAAWYLARAQRQRPVAKTSEILDSVSNDAAPPADPEMRFGLEMLRRALGKAPREDEGWIACLETNPKCHLDSDLGDSPLVDLLTGREAEAVMRRNKRGGAGVVSSPKPAPARSMEPAIGLLLVTGLPSGTVSDLVAVSGCKAGTGYLAAYTVAEIEFGTNGLPRRVHVEPLSSPKCEAAAEALFLMTAESEEGRRGAKREFYVALLEQDVLACDDLAPSQPARGESGVEMVRGAVTAPKLVTKVEPTYPMESRRQHHEGVSIFEAIISQNGCVGEIRLLRSSSPDLDVSGMLALAHWHYTPATLNGRPVRVYLTVTVTFALHKRA